jgi:hypothetical protein
MLPPPAVPSTSSCRYVRTYVQWVDAIIHTYNLPICSSVRSTRIRHTAFPPDHTVAGGGWYAVEHSPRNEAQSAGYYCGFRSLDYLSPANCRSWPPPEYCISHISCRLLQACVHMGEIRWRTRYGLHKSMVIRAWRRVCNLPSGCSMVAVPSGAASATCCKLLRLSVPIIRDLPVGVAFSQQVFRLPDDWITWHLW